MLRSSLSKPFPAPIFFASVYTQIAVNMTTTKPPTGEKTRLQAPIKSNSTHVIRNDITSLSTRLGVPAISFLCCLSYIGDVTEIGVPQFGQKLEFSRILFPQLKQNFVSIGKAFYSVHTLKPYAHRIKSLY